MLRSAILGTPPGFMQPTNALNGYCFSIDIEKWPDEKSLLGRGSQGAGREDPPGWLRSTAGLGGWMGPAADTGAHGALSSWTSDRERSRGTSWPPRFSLSVETCIIDMRWVLLEVCVCGLFHTRISSSCRVASEHGGKGSWAVGGVMGRMRGAPRHETGLRLLEKCTTAFLPSPTKEKDKEKTHKTNRRKTSGHENKMLHAHVFCIAQPTE